MHQKQKYMALYKSLKGEDFREEFNAYKLVQARNKVCYYLQDSNSQELLYPFEKGYVTGKEFDQIIEWYDSMTFEEIEKIKNRKIHNDPKIARCQKEALFEIKIAEDYYNEYFKEE